MESARVLLNATSLRGRVMGATRAVAVATGLGLVMAAAIPAGSGMGFGGVQLVAATTLPGPFKTLISGDLSSYQWSLQATHVASAWTKATGAGVTVAEVDTGIDGTRPDLAGRVLAGAHLNPVTGLIVDGSADDHYSHGTHVAGIIAGNNNGHGITGVAPDAKLLPINLDTGATVTGQSIADGITYAVNHGAGVINLSLGLLNLKIAAADAVPLCAAVANAVNHKVVVVAAAGNDGDFGSIPSAPASCPGAISVAAVDHNLKATTWSSYDGTVSVAAPGDAVYSTVPLTSDASGFASYSGTSMATPFVTGLVALLIEEHPTWTPAQIKAQLENTAADGGPAGFDPVYGHGIVDPAAAVGVGAPAPVAVPYVTAWAYPFFSSADAANADAYDETLVTWRPDQNVKVTGYTLTKYTSSGTTTVDLGPDVARNEVPVVAGGFTVTAHTAGGDIVSAPLWSDPYFSSSLPQVENPTSVTPRWNANGSVTVSWTLPAVDLKLADFGNVTVSSPAGFTYCTFMVTSTTGTCTFAASAVPVSDLDIAVSVYSKDIYGGATAVRVLKARVPFSGSAAKAGKQRYNVTLDLAPSWARKACHSTHCTGVPVIVTCGKQKARGYLDRGDRVSVNLRCAPTVTRTKAGKKHSKLVLSVAPVRKHAALKMKRLVIKLS